ncbi:MarR family transcriptional regulator [Levilactobacillus suantsaii]|uniref:MarR family winged helix-turn-helix transcriptional regulator n=1 Tax=Levilactobacillus suantsaii TaxID=2292255 RepID=UPI0015F71E90|nr:MarR family transcriptional regulator [Levilactobacillus suantsaii]QMU08417.1 MarR family transcriptional regulator [Levilactobacillus suantsaii]
MNQILEADQVPINITEFYLLVLVSESSPINQRMAARTIAVDEGLMTRMVRHLVTIDLLQKTDDPADRRNKQLVLTPAGDQLVRRAIQVLHHWWQNVTPPDTTVNFQAMTEQLQRLSTRVLQFDHPLENL